MTKEEHRQRHVELHQAFDELLADYMRSQPEPLVLGHTIEQLMRWSHSQTIDPTEPQQHALASSRSKR